MARRLKVEAVAYHEAGHAVMAVELRRAVWNVSIVPREDSLGRMTISKSRPVPVGFVPALGVEGKPLKWLEREIMVIAAGEIAETRFTGAKRSIGAGADWYDMERYATQLYSGRVAWAYLGFKIAQTRQHIEQPTVWVQVEALAKALLERKHLTGREARAVCVEAAKDRDRIQELLDDQFLAGRG